VPVRREEKRSAASEAMRDERAAGYYCRCQRYLRATRLILLFDADWPPE